jgi:hypothetical protein
MSSRSLVLDTFRRYRNLTIDLLVALTGLGRKNVERIVAYLRRDGVIRPCSSLGNKRVYTLTVRGAVRLGLDPRKHRRTPGVQAIIDSLFIATFCAEYKQTLMTPAGFNEEFADLAPARGYRRRYFLDEDGTLSIMVPDYGLRPRRLAQKARRAIDVRKRTGKPWMTMIENDGLRVFVLVRSERKAARVRKHLERDTFPHNVVVVTGADELFLSRRTNERARKTR